MIGDTGRKAEKLTIARLKASGMPGSGNMKGAKGDMDKDGSTHELKMENKATERDSLGVQYGWCRKISREARSVGRVPALAIQFVTGDGRPRPDGSWVVIPEWLLDELLES